MAAPLKSPFPYFGGKSNISADVWGALGTCGNYVEPFAGSLAVLLNRPAPWSGPETVNDLNCLLVNAWRAIVSAPAAVAEMCIGPVSEVDTEARHNFLVQNADTIRVGLSDPDWYSVKYAVWWIKGACEWIGTGWCSGEGPWVWTSEAGWTKRDAGKGINRQLPHFGTAGQGINRKLPHFGEGDPYQARIEWVAQWMRALQSRLCNVRIACGDWHRVLGDSTTWRFPGFTGIFLDPPYAGTEYVYGSGTATVAHDVRDWCIANGNNRQLRIVLAGRGTEHDELLNHGWTDIHWSGSSGYSLTDDNQEETLWLSPHCIIHPPAQGELF